MMARRNIMFGIFRALQTVLVHCVFITRVAAIKGAQVAMVKASVVGILTLYMPINNFYFEPNIAYGAPQVSTVKDVNYYTKLGVSLLRSKQVSESVAAFDQAIALNKAVEPYLWQRGLALYFDGKYPECAEQFRNDVAVNPKDTEEAIWNFMCRVEGSEVSNTIGLIKLSGTDNRQVMRTVYNVFDGKTDWKELVDLGYTQNSVSFFYSRLYLSLYFHAQGNKEASLNFIHAAMESDYAHDESSARRDLMIPVCDLFRTIILK